MENNKHIYVALDSDVLRDLTYLSILCKNPNFSPEKCKDVGIKVRLPYLMALLQAQKNDQIRFFIGSTIYNENKHSSSTVRFMKEYCYFPNINMTSFMDAAKKTKELAEAYCKPYIDSRGETTPPPMQASYNAYIGDNVPPNDAFIMAEATINNAILVTNNAKHFLFNPKLNYANQIRQKGIMRINIEHGYGRQDQSGKIYTSVPFSLQVLGSILTSKPYEQWDFMRANDDNNVAELELL